MAKSRVKAKKPEQDDREPKRYLLVLPQGLWNDINKIKVRQHWPTTKSTIVHLIRRGIKSTEGEA